MGHAMVGVQRNGISVQITVKQGSFRVIQLKSNWILHKYKADFSSIEGNLIICFFHPRDYRFHTGSLHLKQRVQAVLPCRCHQNIGFFSKFLVKCGTDPHNLIGNEYNLDIGAVCMYQPCAVCPFNP